MFRLLSLFVTCCVCSSTTVFAQSLDDTSLRFAPADSAFYSSSLRLGEQYDAVVGSRAFRVMAESELVQLGIGQLRMMMESNTEWQDFISDAENKEFFAFLKDAVSNEVFSYGSSEFVTVFELWSDIQKAVVESAQNLDPENSEDEATRILIDVVHQHIDKIQVPDLVFGFKLTDPAVARKQIDRLEALVAEAGDEDVAAMLGRREINGGDFLVLDLSKLLQEQSQEDLIADDLDAATQAKAEEIAGRVKGLGLTVAIGVRGEFLIGSIGESTAAIEKLERQPLLRKLSRFAPVREAAGKRLVSINYASKDLTSVLSGMAGNMSWMPLIAQAMAADEDMDPDLKRDLLSDLEEFIADVTVTPTAGPVLQVAWMKAEGYEGKIYEWGKAKSIDYSKPLGILKNVTGSPVFFHASRMRDNLATYRTVSKWVRRVAQRVEKYGTPATVEVDSEEAKVRKALKQLAPTFERMDTMMQTMLLPGLADGSWGIQFDIESIVLPDEVRAMAPFDVISIPTVSLVLGVSERPKVEAAGKELVRIVEDMKPVLQDIAKDRGPDAEPIPDIPEPDVSATETGVVLAFPVPGKEADESPAYALALGLSDTAMIVARNKEVATKRLDSQKCEIEVLGMQDKSLGSVTYFSFVEVIGLLESYVDLGMRVAAEQDPQLAQQISAMKDGGGFVFDLLRCFRGTTTVTYEEDTAIVTHYEVRFADVPSAGAGLSDE